MLCLSVSARKSQELLGVLSFIRVCFLSIIFLLEWLSLGSVHQAVSVAFGLLHRCLPSSLPTRSCFTTREFNGTSVSHDLRVRLVLSVFAALCSVSICCLAFGARYSLLFSLRVFLLGFCLLFDIRLSVYTKTHICCSLAGGKIRNR